MPTFTDGTFVHQGSLAQLATGITNLSVLLNGVPPPRAYVPTAIAKLTSTRSLTTATDTTITFDSATVNNDGIWVAARAAFVIQTGGVYTAYGQGSFTANATGTRSVSILLNGTIVAANSVALAARKAASGTDLTTLCAQTPAMYLAPGATLYFNAWQNSGGTLTIGTGLSGTFMCVERIGN